MPTTLTPATFANFFAAISNPSAGLVGGDVILEPGRYILTSTVDIIRFSGRITGAGLANDPSYSAQPSSGVTFLWAGPAGQPMIRVIDSRGVEISGIRFEGKDTAIPSAGIEFHRRGIQDDNGTNAQIHVHHCHFGVWPWSTIGSYQGKIQAGIAVTGLNGNNDQFTIGKCTFADKDGFISWGVRIDNPQSIWGRIVDCFFDDVGLGIDANATVTVVNPQFNKTFWGDIRALGTAHVYVDGWNSENARTFATVAPTAGLHVRGGIMQQTLATMAANTVMLDAWPSGNGQHVSFDQVRFSGGGSYTTTGSRPYLRFGTDSATNQSANADGFHISFDDCLGIKPDQIRQHIPTGQTPMYASGPGGFSKGLVQMTSRHNDGRTSVRNEMGNSSILSKRNQYDPTKWDEPWSTAGTEK